MTGVYTRNTAGNPLAQNPTGAPADQGATVQAGNPALANPQPVNALASSALDNAISVTKEPKEAYIVAKSKYIQTT